MKRDLLLIFLIPFCLGAAPSRTQTYTAGQVIDPAAVTENEDNVFSYLQAGVDTIRNNAVETADLQDAAVTAAKLGTGAVGATAIASGAVDAGDMATTGTIADDKAFIADSATAGTWRTVTNCADTTGNHLNYTQSTNSFSCGTSRSALSAITSVTTRAADANTGTQAITGLGFVPTSCTAQLYQNGTGGDGAQTFSTGYVDSGLTHAVIRVSYDNAAGDDYSQQVNFAAATEVGVFTNGQTVTIQSFDSDGYTLSWTETGTGPAMIWTAICYR